MKIAIIGAGVAGICAGRHCLDEKFSFDIFEQTGTVGGIWVYTNFTDRDENGVPVHTSMYKGLWTNVPRELMTLEDHPYSMEESYITQEQVLEYIKNYVERFNINPHIKFFKRVLKVDPSGSKWLIEWQDIKNGTIESALYDAVMVCNGHYEQPVIPEITGIETFPGGIKHSREYRTPEDYEDKIVLIVGEGPSGTDISKIIQSVAAKVYISCKTSESIGLPPEIIQKSTVVRFDGHEVYFNDDTVEKIDAVLFCTGYYYNFPFLTQNCGIKVKDNYIYPLYKQMINIEHPTMALIALLQKVCVFPLCDIQIRFFLSTLNGHFNLPTKEQMLDELKLETKQKSEIPLKQYHFIGLDQGKYFDQLANIAKIKRIPPVITSLYGRVRTNRNLKDNFRIIDDENWEQIS